jgi:hypothetical protein
LARGSGLVIVEPPGRDRYNWLGQETSLTGPRLIRAWRRWSGIEHLFRALKHLLATEACQMPGDDAYYGHVVLRLVTGLVLLYTARVVFEAQVTLAQILFSCKPR